MQEYRRRRSTNPCECGCGKLVFGKFARGHHVRLLAPKERKRRSAIAGDTLRGTGSKPDSYIIRNQRFEHRVVAEEQILHRPLREGEVVHHRNHVKKDNRPENLQVFASQAEHTSWHIAHPEPEDT